MNKKNLFTIRKIRNRNPRLPRLARNFRQKFFRLALVIVLAIVGVTSLFFFSGNANLLSSDAVDILGSGFENITDFSNMSYNEGVNQKAEGFQEDGIITINSLLYNIKDYLKYIAGGVAVLYLIVAAMQIIMSRENEGIEKGKKNLFWSIFALVLIFVIDIMVVAFYEGGGGAPGQSLFSVDQSGAIDKENLSLFSNIAAYFKANARTIFSYLKTLIGAFAIMFIVFAGVQMVTAGGSDEKIEKEKKYLMHVITAFVTILLLDTMIFNFIYPDSRTGASDPVCAEFMSYVNGGGLNTISLPDMTAAEAKYTDFSARLSACRSAGELGAVGSNQILGIVKFFETLIGGIAIFFMVYSGVMIIGSMGEEETMKKHRTTLLWSIGGLVIVLIANTAITKFFFVVDPATGVASVEPTTGLYAIAGVTNFIATFVGIFSVISIIVAGFMWVANFGNDDLAGKAKKVILAAVVGVVLSVSAYAIVNTLANANSQGGTGTSIGVSI